MPPKKTGTAPTRASTRIKATPDAPEKPTANTKAKVTKKAPTKTATGKPRGRPKKEETTAATAKGKAKATTPEAAPKKRGRPPKKAAAASAEPEEKPKASRKRKATDEPEVAPTKKTKVITKGEVINEVPTQKLHVYVFGEGSSGELGLGTAKNAIDVKRPRLNAILEKEGVVQIAAGGMHVIALTADNRILTWGVNDQGALGRDTNWEGGLKDMDDNKSDSDSDDEADDNGLNPHESTPTAIPADKFHEDTVFVQVAAGDSMSFALTDDGQVWGWGTFRSNEGIFGFTADVLVQKDPLLIPGLKKVTRLACGANHVLALDSAGSVFAWGSGQQNQLGRKVVERTKVQGLTPREFGLPKKQVKYISCGAYHSFAIDRKDRVFTWGLNNYGETGIPESAGEDDAVIISPKEVKALSGKNITCIQGGGHHSIAVTGEGDCLVWGRVDGHQMGIPTSELDEEDVIKDQRDAPRILKVPTKVTAIAEPVALVTAGSDHSIAITQDGKAYSWGFSTNYQCGLGTTDDIEVATRIENTAVKDKKLNFAAAGGQYSLLTSPMEEVATTNGVNGNAH